MITQNGKTIHLTGKDFSYVMFEDEDRNLLNFHFGKRIADLDYSEMEEEWKEGLGFVSDITCLDVYPQEYPAYGYTDLRNPAYQVENRFGNMVSAQRIISIVSPESAPIKRMVQDVRERGLLIDASFGRSTKAVIIMDSGNVVLSALTPEVLAARFEE